jgi:hypothetical protein
MYYRIYYMADESTRVRGFEPVEADDDGAAVAHAEARQRSVTMELWCADRMVKRWSLVPDADTLNGVGGGSPFDSPV